MQFIKFIISFATYFFSRITRRAKWVCATSLLAIASSASMGQTRLLVDDSSTATTPNGLTWATAFQRLQDAIAAQASTGTTQIWVAAGTYKPTTGTSRTATFQMADDLAIYGGFVGNEPLNNTGFQSRDPVANITTLSGAINQTTETDNTYHIVTADSTDDAIGDTSILDGFTIRDAYAVDAPQLVVNETVSAGAGGGLVILGAADVDHGNSAVFLRLRFTNNEAARGAGVYVHLLVREHGGVQWRNCVWDHNHATAAGAGLFAASDTPLLINPLLHDNTSDGVGAAIACLAEGGAEIRNGTVTQNHSDAGGALWDELEQPCSPGLNQSSLFLHNVILWGNSEGDPEDPDFGSLDAQVIGCAFIVNSDIEALDSPYGSPGTDGNIDDDPDFVSPTTNNFRLQCSSPAVDVGENLDVAEDVFDLFQNGALTNGHNPDSDRKGRVVATIVDMGAYERQASGGTCVADVDGSCTVDVDDLVGVILQWGACDAPPAPCTADILPLPCPDGTVDVDDLVAVILNWGDCEGGCSSIGEAEGASPESYEDCEDMCSSLSGDAWSTCMQGCFMRLCQGGHTEFCDD